MRTILEHLSNFVASLFTWWSTKKKLDANFFYCDEKVEALLSQLKTLKDLANLRPLFSRTRFLCWKITACRNFAGEHAFNYPQYELPLSDIGDICLVVRDKLSAIKDHRDQIHQRSELDELIEEIDRRLTFYRPERPSSF